MKRGRASPELLAGGALMAELAEAQARYTQTCTGRGS